MFIAKTKTVGQKCIVTFCGSFKPNNGHKGEAPYLSKELQEKQEFESFDELNKSCREDLVSEHDRQVDRALNKNNFVGVKEVIITTHKPLVDFNGHEEGIVNRIRRSIPKGAKVEVKIVSLARILGNEFIIGELAKTSA